MCEEQPADTLLPLKLLLPFLLGLSTEEFQWLRPAVRNGTGWETRGVSALYMPCCICIMVSCICFICWLPKQCLICKISCHFPKVFTSHAAIKAPHESEWKPFLSARKLTCCRDLGVIGCFLWRYLWIWLRQSETTCCRWQNGITALPVNQAPH